MKTSRSANALAGGRKPEFEGVSDHVEGEVAQLEAAGVTIELPVQDHPKYAITQAFVLDPDGYRLEIQRFHDPNWNQSPS